jgi:cyanophycinase
MLVAMRILPALLVASCLSTVALAVFASTQSPRPGPLVVAGGGGTTDDIAASVLRLGGGAEARMVLVPWASENPDAGAESLEFWRGKGASKAEVVSEDALEAARQLEGAAIIWMGGGDQKVLVDKLRAKGLDAVVARRHKQGAVVGGTSAGAAAQSKAMILGGDSADLEVAKNGGTALGEGLHLLEDAIVDQHFLKRRRFARLLSAVLDNPGLVGIGVDERTAAIVHAGAIEVVGEGQVLVVDAREAKVERCEPGARHAATGMRLDLLRAGSRLRIDGRKE